MSDEPNVLPFGDQEQRYKIEFGGGVEVWIKASQFGCPTCGGVYFSHPRLGLRHICTDRNTVRESENG
jgi:hypothetical protein